MRVSNATKPRPKSALNRLEHPIQEDNRKSNRCHLSSGCLCARLSLLQVNLGKENTFCCDSTGSELPCSATWQPGEAKEVLVGLLPVGWGLCCPVLGSGACREHWDLCGTVGLGRMAWPSCSYGLKHLERTGCLQCSSPAWILVAEYGILAARRSASGASVLVCALPPPWCGWELAVPAWPKSPGQGVKPKCPKQNLV